MIYRAVVEDQTSVLDLPNPAATLDLIKITTTNRDIVNVAIGVRELGQPAFSDDEVERIAVKARLGHMKGPERPGSRFQPWHYARLSTR